MFEYLFSSLMLPLKDTSLIFRVIFRTIILSFEDTIDYLQQIVQHSFIKNNKEFHLWAKERAIAYIRNESQESYYSRVLNAYSFLKNSSTKSGMENILRSFTNKDFQIRELYKENFVLGNKAEILGVNTVLQSSLASFYFVVDFKNSLNLDEKLYIEKIINIYKPAHIGFHINATVIDNWILGKEEEYLGISTYL